MQRVATELHAALEGHSEIDLTSIVMRSSWTRTHLKTGPFLAGAYFQLRKRIRRGDVDAVLFSSMVSASLAVPLKRTLSEHGVFSSAIVHGRDVTLDLQPYQRFVPHIFNALDAVLPVSHATADACRLRGVDDDKLYVVPNGVSANRFRADENRDEARMELLARFQESRQPDLESGRFLCSVGRHIKRKGFAWFVEHVLPLLPPDVHYWLAGDGPESGRILNAAGRRGVADRVRLLGRVSDADLELLYCGADLFVMPNVPVPGDMEGFGIVMLEAGFCGLPTIASRLEGITDVIREGENGHLVPSGDAWAFSEAIMQYYHAPTVLKAASARASSYVADHFTWRAVASHYVDVLRTITAPALSDDAFV